MSSFQVWFDVSDAMSGFGKLRDKIIKAIEKGIELTAEQLLRDARPYVPMLTGALRDSGRVEKLKRLAYRLIWDAANPINGFVYAERQHEEVFQHVDGKYAAEWVTRTLKANKGRYTFLAARFMESELAKAFKTR